MLEEFQGHLDDAKRKCAESESKTKSANKLLGQVNNGVEHLTEKMQHIKAVRKYCMYCNCHIMCMYTTTPRNGHP